MKLRITILPLLVFAMFGYSVSVLERTQVEGEVETNAMIDRVTDDYKNVEEFMATGSSANHDNYNK